MRTKRRRGFDTKVRTANVSVPPIIEQKFRETLQSLPDSAFTYRYLKDEVFSKYVSDDTDPANVRRQRAINKWLSVDSQNGASNVRLMTVDPEYNLIPRVSWETFADRCRSLIESIIGPVPPEDVIIGGFSGGASTSRLRDSSHPALKLVGKADVTPRATQHAIRLLTEYGATWWYEGKVTLNVVPGNVMFTVPKAVDIDRCAAKEPDLNMFMQRGVGSYFRKRLRRVGIDLNDQSRNKRLAARGSSDGSLCTLDLSSASDSISCVLVEELLPIHWYGLLCDLRSPVTLIDGYEHTNEMFSSMGNGFTFELESLLFYAIAKTVLSFEGISGVVSVYGDDIIVPTDIATTLISVLSFLGFYPNEDKSHFSGTFRESCGGHYDGGYDVTPFYVKAPVRKLSDLILLLNKIRKWSGQDSLGVLDPCFEPFWFWAKDFVPRRLWGGRDLGSNSQLVTPDEPQYRLVPKVRRETLGVGGYLLSLFGGSEGSSLTDRSIALNSYRYAKVQFGTYQPVTARWLTELH